ncbi:MAG: hypothetical protein ACJ72A_14800 [Nocardioidaceae bacterium]
MLLRLKEYTGHHGHSRPSPRARAHAGLIRQRHGLDGTPNVELGPGAGVDVLVDRPAVRVDLKVETAAGSVSEVADLADLLARSRGAAGAGSRYDATSPGSRTPSDVLRLAIFVATAAGTSRLRAAA